MRPETQVRRRPAPPVPDVELEEEVDLGRYWGAISARWWLPLLGLLLGAAVGYVLAVGSGDVYRAEAIIYLGQPFSPGGDAPVQSPATNPTTVGEIVRSESALKAAARRSGMRVGGLRGNVATQPISGARGALRPGQNQLVEISVKGQGAAKVATAANVLATRVVDSEAVSGYVDDKIATLEEQIESDERDLRSIDRRLARAESQLRSVLGSRDLGTTQQLVLITNYNAIIGSTEQRRAIVQQDLLEAQQQVSLARRVERAQILEDAVAVKTTARSVRNTLLVGALLGLLLGAIAALFWEPLSARLARSTV